MSFRPQLERLRGALALAAFAVLPAAAQTADFGAGLTGALTGWVRDDRGAPQMGATVSVLADDGRPVRRVFTDYSGEFRVDGLLPGAYVVRFALGRFAPLTREGVEVKAASRTVLDVSMRGLFSSLQLSYPGPGEVRDMTDDWKRVLRTAWSTRPPLRLSPSAEYRESRRVMSKVGGAFGETVGYAEVSGGQGMNPGALANHSDLGTSFALATSVFGENNLTVSGNLGYNAAGATPSTGFRAGYSRDLGPVNPEVTVTVRQLQTSAVGGRAFLDAGQAGAASPTLETFTLGYGDRVEIGDSTEFEYGFLYETVRFADRLDFLSPYGKLVYRPTEGRRIELRYASGAPRPDLEVRGGERLRQQVSALGMFPRVAVRDGHATVQRTEHIELAYREELGRNLVEAAVFQDTVTDAAISAFVPEGMNSSGNVLPNLFSRASTINGGRHFSRGYRVSYARKLADRLEAALGYGNSGVVTAEAGAALESGSVAELRERLTVGRAHLATASLSARLPGAGGQVVTSYQWISRPSAMAADAYNDFASSSDPGWNIRVRQPLPIAAGPGKLELTADLRNLLRAGYVPLRVQDGQTLFLIQAIRSYRGSLSFIF